MTRRTAVVALLGTLAVLGATAPAGTAGPTPASSRTLYAFQEGCGDGPPRLVPVAYDYAHGCGFVGGLPGAEVQHLAGTAPVLAAQTYGYLSDRWPVPLRLDRNRPVTGQVAAEGWYPVGFGAGQVTWDIRLWGLPARGRPVDLGRTAVSATIRPGDTAVTAPFRLVLPPHGAGPWSAVRLDVHQRGLNAGMTARRLGKHTRVVLPVRSR